MTALAKCPLCGCETSKLEGRFEVARIVGEWSRQFGMDVSGEFAELREIALHRCSDCTLKYFHPDSVTGSASLYERLEKFDWYYMKRKWEHDVALDDLRGSSSGIEVGCGFGGFVGRVKEELGIPFEGCEQNPSAVHAARASGLAVHLLDVGDFARERPGGYDAVCSFQVLEHVRDPGDFLRASCELLRPGGRLMIGVPDAESFLRYQYNILDMPPHHMTRWTAAVFGALERLFPLNLRRIVREPLAEYHVEGYLEAHASRLNLLAQRALCMPRIRSRITSLLRRPTVRRFLRGQSIYACYVRS